MSALRRACPAVALAALLTIRAGAAHAAPAGPPAPGALAVPLPVPDAGPGTGGVTACAGAVCLRKGGWVHVLPLPPARPAGGPAVLAGRAQAILQAAAASGAPRPPVLFLPAAREPGRHVVIHKGLNRLYLLDGRHVLAVFPVGTGRSPELTPEGRFRVAVKGVYPAWRQPDGRIVPGGVPENPLGARWIGFSVRPGDGGLKYGIHGTNRPSSIGGYVSSGCVRMHNGDVIWLFERVPVGAWVYIER